MKNNNWLTVLAVVFVLAVFLFVDATVKKAAMVKHLAEVESARLSGYADCMMDMTAIIANGGGIDEVLAFSTAKAESHFSDEVKPERFFKNDRHE